MLDDFGGEDAVVHGGVRAVRVPGARAVRRGQPEETGRSTAVQHLKLESCSRKAACCRR